MSAAAVRPVVARANVARRYVPHANVARGAADRFRRRASHRDWDRNARVEISRRRERGARGPIGTGSARTSRRAHERREALHVPAIADAGARLEARAIETRRSPVECRARFHPSRSAIRFERLRNTGTRAARVRSSPRLADRPTPSSLAPQLYPRGRPRRQEPLRPCVRTTPARPPQFKATLIVSLFGGAEPLGSLAFSLATRGFRETTDD